jgi:outer membrane receptor protein involved in Fe transport
MMSIFTRFKPRLYLITILLTTILLGPAPAIGQVLEEIIVTAQRREQSLQDVPIAIDVYAADTLQKEGFDNLEELSAFTPAVFVNEGGDQGSDVFIRGFGTVGRNWANDSATPLFLDNVNLGQGSMGALGFMDVQRVEVLKGPQPIHFGMNATGGAMSIVSARPTQEWEGFVNAETGQTGDMSAWKRFGDKELEAAVSGPITDTLAFRLAGIYSSRDGYLRDAVTGYPMGYRNFLGGRLSLQWEPTDNLTVFGKIELAQQQWAAASRVCRRDQADYPNRFARTPNTATFADVETDPTAMWLDYAEGGTGWNTPIHELDVCGDNYAYTGQTYVREAPTVFVRTRDTTTGFPDIRLASAYFLNNVAGGDWNVTPVVFGTGNLNGYFGNGTGITNNGYMDDQFMEPKNFQVDVNYRFDSNVEVQWTNNYMESYYQDASADRNTPFAENIRNRLEDYNQMSSEIRLSSYEPGMIEWMVGAFIQKEDLHFTTIDARAEIRFNNRLNDNYQQAVWNSYFGNLTYNFWDTRMSVDAGVRYSKAKKDPRLVSYNSSWIYDVTPCTGRTTTNPATSANPNAWRGDTTDWGGRPVQDVTPTDCIKGLEPLAQRISAEDALYLIPSLNGRNVNLNNLWFVPVSTQRSIPATWRGNYTAAVGMTPWSTQQRAAEQWSNIERSWDHWDPQLVLRYRPSDELSTYFKYATAFKAGAYDLGFGGSQPLNTDPGGFDELLIDPEYSETFEFGASGTFLDGRGRYNATLFRVDFEDLIATTVTDVGTDTQSTEVINIGAQRAQGLELDGQFAVTDQLMLGANFSYLDSKFTYFPNANCTEHEVRTFEESGCEIIFKPGFPQSISDFNNILVAVIDRAGQTAAFAPEFSGTFNVDYWIPFRGYKVDMGTRVIASSSYYTDFRTFDKSTIQKSSADMNLHLGIGDMDDKWHVGLALRNLLEPRSTFRPEYTSNITELAGESLRSNQVKSVALTFKYNFFN